MERNEPKLTKEALIRLADEALESYKAIKLKTDEELKSPEMQKILAEGHKYLATADAIQYQDGDRNHLERQRLFLLAIKNGNDLAIPQLHEYLGAIDWDLTFMLIKARCIHFAKLYSKDKNIQKSCYTKLEDMFDRNLASRPFDIIKNDKIRVSLLPFAYYFAVMRAPGPQFNKESTDGMLMIDYALRHILSEFAMQMPEQFDALLDKDPFEKVWPSFKSIFQKYNDKVDDHVATEVLRRYKQRHIGPPAGEIVQMHQTIPGGSPTNLDEIYASLLSRDEKASDVKEIVTEVHRQLASTYDTAKALETSHQDLVNALSTKNNDAIFTAMFAWLELIRKHLELRINATALQYGSTGITSTTSSEARSKIIDYKKEIEDVLSDLKSKIKPKLESSTTFIHDMLKKIAIIDNRCPAEEKLIKQQAALLTKKIKQQYPTIVQPGKR